MKSRPQRLKAVNKYPRTCYLAPSSNHKSDYTASYYARKPESFTRILERLEQLESH